MTIADRLAQLQNEGRMTTDELRAWLDRKPPPPDRDADIKPWEFWFTVRGECLGQRSARTGPDPTGAKQPCTCDVCNKGRQAAKVAPQSTNGEDASI